MFLVVFRSRKRADLDAETYARDAARMKDMALARPGLLAVKTYAAEDGETVSISEWADEESAKGWREDAEHLVMQRRGREAYYESYTVFTMDDPRTHRFPTGD